MNISVYPRLNKYTRLNDVLILIIIFITPLLFTNKMMYEFHTAKYLSFQFAVILLLFTSILLNNISLKINWLDILIILRPLLFIIFGLSLKRYSTVSHHIDILFFLSLFHLLVKISSSSKSDTALDKTITLVIIGTFIVSTIEGLYGLLQYFNIDFFRKVIFQSNESNAIGTFGSENALGAFLAIGVICGLYLLKISHQRTKIIAILMALAIIITTLILTLSRGAWIACMIGILFFYLPKIIGKSNKIILPFIILLLLGSSVGFYMINKDSSEGRIYIWRVSHEMIKDHPFLGIGYGNYGYQYINYQAKFFEDEDNVIYQDKASSLKDAHSEMVHSLAETGIIGFLLFIGIFMLFFYYSFSLLKTESGTNLRFLVTIVIVMFVHSLIDNILHVLPIAVILYFIFAIISFKTDKYDDNNHLFKKTLFTCRINSNWILISLCACILLFNSYLIIKNSAGQIAWKKGQESVYNGNWIKGIEYYQKALKYLPDNGELQFHLGAAYSFVGQPEEAINLLNKSLERFNDKNIYISLGNAYWSLGEYDKAEKNFIIVAKMFPQMLAPHFWLASLYYDMGQTGKSIYELKFIIDAKPKIMSDEVMAIKNDAIFFLEKILPHQ